MRNWNKGGPSPGWLPHQGDRTGLEEGVSSPRMNRTEFAQMLGYRDLKEFDDYASVIDYQKWLDYNSMFGGYGPGNYPLHGGGTLAAALAHATQVQLQGGKRGRPKKSRSKKRGRPKKTNKRAKRIKRIKSKGKKGKSKSKMSGGLPLLAAVIPALKATAVRAAASSGVRTVAADVATNIAVNKADQSSSSGGRKRTKRKSRSKKSSRSKSRSKSRSRSRSKSKSRSRSRSK